MPKYYCQVELKSYERYGKDPHSYEPNNPSLYYHTKKEFKFEFHNHQEVEQLAKGEDHQFLAQLAFLLSQSSHNVSDVENVYSPNRDIRHGEENQSLQTEIKRLQDENQQLRLNNQILEFAKRSLEKQVAEWDNDKLQREKSALEIENQKLNSRIDKYIKENDTLKLSKETPQRKQHQELQQKYKSLDEKHNKLIDEWNILVGRFNDLNNQVAGIPYIQREKNELKKSKQNLEKQVKDLEQELDDVQQKLLVATTRLRSIKGNPNLVGGGSRSDQLKNEFDHLKNGLFRDASSNVLNAWIAQGITLSSRSPFRSEEFFRIKSLLSQRVFCDGMAYFAQDKHETDAELHLIMEELFGMKNFTLALFHELQGRIQTGLLRAKGVDNSDEALLRFAEETTQRIVQDLRQIANYPLTNDALAEIKNFVKSGLRIVRDIVNDPNSGTLYIPEEGAIFDEKFHETRYDQKGSIKMTICAGYRVADAVLVKADVLTEDRQSPNVPPYQAATERMGERKDSLPPQANEERSDSFISQSSDLPNHQEEVCNSPSSQTAIERIAACEDSLPPQANEERSDSFISQSSDLPNHQEEVCNSPSSQTTIERIATCEDSLPPQANEERSDSSISQSSDLPNHQEEASKKNERYGKSEKTSTTFYGKVIFEYHFYTAPHWDAPAEKKALIGEEFSFEGWTHTPHGVFKKWYKLAEQDYWFPAPYIKGEHPSDLPAMNSEKRIDDAR